MRLLWRDDHQGHVVVVGQGSRQQRGELVLGLLGVGLGLVSGIVLVCELALVLGLGLVLGIVLGMMLMLWCV